MGAKRFTEADDLREAREAVAEVVALGRQRQASHLEAVPEIEWDQEPEEYTASTLDMLRGCGRLPEAFWGHATLRTIRDVARARYQSPEAVLGSVMARVQAMAPVGLRAGSVPGMPNGTLNGGTILAAPPGMGKSLGYRTASLLLPTPLVFNADGREDLVEMAGVSTGEGLLDQFCMYRKGAKREGDDGETVEGPPERVMLASRVLAYQDEIQALLAQIDRPNNTIGAVLSSMLQGHGYETPNADLTRKRKVDADSYRLAVVTGGQPARLQTLYETAGQGLVQRFLVFNAIREQEEDPALAGVQYGQELGEAELEAVVAALTDRSAQAPVESLKVATGQPLGQWVSALPDRTMELPSNAVVDVAKLLDQATGKGLESDLDVHRPRQMITMYHVLNLLCGSVHPDPEVWRRTRMLWDAHADARDTYHRAALEDARQRRLEEDSRYIARAAQSRQLQLVEMAVPPYVAKLVEKLAEVADQGGLTKTKANQNYLTKRQLDRHAPGWSKARVLEYAVNSGLLVLEGGVLMRGRA